MKFAHFLLNLESRCSTLQIYITKRRLVSPILGPEETLTVFCLCYRLKWNDQRVYLIELGVYLVLFLLTILYLCAKIQHQVSAPDSTFDNFSCLIMQFDNFSGSFSMSRWCLFVLMEGGPPPPKHL